MPVSNTKNVACLLWYTSIGTSNHTPISCCSFSPVHWVPTISWESVVPFWTSSEKSLCSKTIWMSLTMRVTSCSYWWTNIMLPRVLTTRLGGLLLENEVDSDILPPSLPTSLSLPPSLSLSPLFHIFIVVQIFLLHISCLCCLNTKVVTNVREKIKDYKAYKSHSAEHCSLLSDDILLVDWNE